MTVEDQRSDPLVAVVIPCYNDRGYLAQCIQSLAEQTFHSWNAVVVDDASTLGDPSGVVEALGDARVSCLRLAENRGQGAARNAGIRAISGALVVPLDADDYLAPSFLEELSDALLQQDSVTGSFADFQYVGDIDAYFRFQVEDVRSLLRHQWLPGPGSMFRRDIWERVGGYCEDRRLVGNEDYDFWIAVAGHGLKVAHVPKPLYYYRRHPASITATSLAAVEYSHRRIMYERHRELFDRFDAGRPFIAEGYRRSAYDALRRRKPARAAGLAAGAFWYAPLDSLGELVKHARRGRASQGGWGREQTNARRGEGP